MVQCRVVGCVTYDQLRKPFSPAADDHTISTIRHYDQEWTLSKYSKGLLLQALQTTGRWMRQIIGDLVC
jgi:hypothetical protein